jgi:hypothetical protein
MKELIDLIINKKPFIFTKYGDGEYNASIGLTGCNCDKTYYTEKLKNGVNESLK